MVEHCINEASHHRFGILPTNGLQGPERVRQVNHLVADTAKISGCEFGQLIKYTLRTRVSDERGDRDIRSLNVPLFKAAAQSLGCEVCWRHCRFIDRCQRPISLRNITLLRTLEIIDGPENGQPAVFISTADATLASLPGLGSSSSG